MGEGTRLLWVSNGRRWRTGYGNQTDLFVPRIKRAGYDPVIFDFTSRSGAPSTDKDGIFTLPRWVDSFGSDIYAGHMNFTEAVFSFGLFDFFAINPEVYAGRNHAQWIPIDGTPARPDNVKALRQGAKWVVAMSQHGVRELRRAGFDPLYVPHGVDTAAFTPIDRQTARQRLGEALKTDLTGKFVIATNAANVGQPGRKGFYEGLAAFKALCEVHPDAVLILHTDRGGSRGESLDMHMAALDVDPTKVFFPPQYHYLMGMLNSDYLNDMYNAADVLLHPSYGEGFGIPIVEAQAAGCPVIVTEASSMPELCFSGWKVPGVLFAYAAGVYWCRPEITKLTAALCEAYERRGDQTLRDQARAGALAYDVDSVMQKYMLPALEQIESDIAHPAEYTARRHKLLSEVQVNGVPLTVRTHSNDAWIAVEVQKTYAPDLIDYKTIKAVVDVGAHIGSFSAWVKQQSPDAKVIAIEANPDNASLARQNLMDLDGVTVKEARCGYEAGPLEMWSDPKNTGAHTLYPAGQTLIRRGDDMSEHHPYEGDSVTLESVLGIVDNTAENTVLKLDCEGGEFDILSHAELTTLARFTWIVGEYHADLGDIQTAAGRLADSFDLVRLQPTSSNLGVFVFKRRAA